MTSKWLIDEDHPGGYLVELTPAEEAQHDQDQAAGRAMLERETARAEAKATIIAELESRLPKLTGTELLLARLVLERFE